MAPPVPRRRIQPVAQQVAHRVAHLVAHRVAHLVVQQVAFSESAVPCSRRSGLAGQRPGGADTSSPTVGRGPISLPCGGGQACRARPGRRLHRRLAVPGAGRLRPQLPRRLHRECEPPDPPTARFPWSALVGKPGNRADTSYSAIAGAEVNGGSASMTMSRWGSDSRRPGASEPHRDPDQEFLGEVLAEDLAESAEQSEEDCSGDAAQNAMPGDEAADGSPHRPCAGPGLRGAPDGEGTGRRPPCLPTGYAGRRQAKRPRNLGVGTDRSSFPS